MNDSQITARLRHEMLTVMYQATPTALSFEELTAQVQFPFLTRDKAWLIETVRSQLDVLNHAGLIRPTTKGYLLTEKGKQDRQQAARFFPTTPKDAA